MATPKTWILLIKKESRDSTARQWTDEGIHHRNAPMTAFENQPITAKHNAT